MPSEDIANRVTDCRSAVLDSLVDSVITMDESGRILTTNIAVERQLGYSKQELIGKDVTLLMPEPHASVHRDYVGRYLETGERRIIGIGRHVQALKKDGSLLDISLAVSEAKLDGQRIFTGVLRDISVQVQREQELQRQHDELAIQARVNHITQTASSAEQLLTSVMEILISLAELEVQSKAGLFLIDAEANRGSGSFERFNAQGAQDSRKGLRLAKTIGQFPHEFLEREAWIPMGACLCGRAAVSGEIIVSGNCFKDPRHEHQFKGMAAHGHYIVPLKSQGDVIGVIFLYTDPDPAWDAHRVGLFETLGTQIGVALDRIWTLSELQVSREQLFRLASRDPLTDLGNRRAILETLDSERTRAQRKNQAVGVLLIDIDRFKSVNDNYGHPIGDDVLVETASRLTASIRPYDSVGRLGGEEFLIILPDASLDESSEVAERIRASMAAIPVSCRDALDVSVTISVGVTSTNGRTLDAVGDEQLIEEADKALYRAKQNGRNRVERAETASSGI
jgi:diguanylate cyclase (GGDEF)-like protein/PAS domain S-box-containing protein